jgi:hypothetical protein
MVAIARFTGKDFHTLTSWNVSARAGLGSSGDDVRLIQYLLARAPEAGAIRPDRISGESGITVDDVDGMWGPKTTAGVSWLEQNYHAKNGNDFADGVIDPMPFHQDHFVVGSTTFQYKIMSLQVLYCIVILQDRFETASDDEFFGTIMAMPDDGQCPVALGIALTTAATLQDFR